MTKNTTENNKKDADIIFTTMLKNILKKNWYLFLGILIINIIIIFIEAIYLPKQYAKAKKFLIKIVHSLI